MELKPPFTTSKLDNFMGFNRTFMELKRHILTRQRISALAF